MARLAPPDTAMLPPPESEGALWQAPRKQVGFWECIECIAHVPQCVPGVGPSVKAANKALFCHPSMQAPVAVDPGRIDVRDLDPRLTRKEVEQYYIIDDGFDLTVVLPLDEPVPTEQVVRYPGVHGL